MSAKEDVETFSWAERLSLTPLPFPDAFSRVKKILANLTHSWDPE